MRKLRYKVLADEDQNYYVITCINPSAAGKYVDFNEPGIQYRDKNGNETDAETAVNNVNIVLTILIEMGYEVLNRRCMVVPYITTRNGRIYVPKNVWHALRDGSSFTVNGEQRTLAFNPNVYQPVDIYHGITRDFLLQHNMTIPAQWSLHSHASELTALTLVKSLVIDNELSVILPKVIQTSQTSFEIFDVDNKYNSPDTEWVSVPVESVASDAERLPADIVQSVVGRFPFNYNAHKDVSVALVKLLKKLNSYGIVLDVDDIIDNQARFNLSNGLLSFNRKGLNG